MARREIPIKTSSGPDLLLTPRDQAKAQLLSRVEQGNSLQKTVFKSIDDLEAAREVYQAWNSFNVELLSRMFSGEQYVAEYNNVYSGITIAFDFPESPDDEVKNFLKRVRSKNSFLANMVERLDIIGEKPGVGGAVRSESARMSGNTDSKKVFVVHGQDEEAKAVVARFIEHCGLTPVILHEKADRGRTIIEKFEQETDVGFAVVLLTPDDVGGLATVSDPPMSDKLQLRARQNVILELGYFIGKLGRPRVCALRRGDVELPSDFSGVVYTPFNAEAGWKISLAKELKAAGYEIDLNTALL